MSTYPYRSLYHCTTYSYTVGPRPNEINERDSVISIRPLTAGPIGDHELDQLREPIKL